MRKNDMMFSRKGKRRQAVAEHKRGLIVEAARDIFIAEGLEGASVRAIAARAGYTPAALYFYFESREAIYAEVLQQSLGALDRHIRNAVGNERAPDMRLRSAALAFFGFYAENPRDLDLGFYLFRGGMKPAGLGRERDVALNKALEAALQPVGEAAKALGATYGEAELLTVDIFAHAAGLLLLLHTGRIRMFGACASERMESYVETCIERLRRRDDDAGH